MSPQTSFEGPLVGGSGIPQRTRRITGIVRNGLGHPVEGASVSGFHGGWALTNGAGEFEITFPENSGLQINKVGYEPTLGQGADYLDGHWNAVLHQVIRIAVGESVRVSVSPTDARESFRDDFLDGNYRARTVRLDVRSRMRVQFQLAADDAGHAVLCIHNGGCYESFPVVIPSDGGVEIVTRIMNGPYPTTSRAFTLTTTALPASQ
jgi:hypothetical protein